MKNRRNHISFIRCDKKSEPLLNSENYDIKFLFLLSGSINYSIFNFIPKSFTITTNNGSSNFNIQLIKDTSSVIKQFLDENPQSLQYHLDIIDEDNILGKFEQMYQGEFVIFDDDELPICHKITKMLNISKCPNFMKPESMKSPETLYNNYIQDNCLGVEIDSLSLDQYLQCTAPRSFTITTNKKEYKCNIFGVYSSTVINQILTEDPTTNMYVYKYDDEFNEFQLICDLFNFKQVTLTKNNMNSIKEIAEDLQIEVIMDDINNYINSIEKVSQSIDEYQTIIDSIEDTFESLYNIKEKTVETVKNEIIESMWPHTEDNVKELAAFILQVVKTDMSLHSYLIELLEQLDKEADETNKLNILVQFIKKILLNSAFENSKQISMTSLSFIFKLYKKGFIEKDALYDELGNIIDNSSEYQSWFYPELIEIKDNNNMKMTKKVNQFIKTYLPDKIELYKQMRDSGEPDDEITKALRNDDVDTFQRILSKSNCNISKSFVPFNIFEDFIDNGKTRYINYAAAYGSIKCFKYLLLNHDKIDSLTFSYSIYGGNVEIIKIVDQKVKEEKIKYSSNNIIPSIIKHRNDIFDWILNENYSGKEINNSELLDLIHISVKNGNAHSFIEIIDKGFNFLNNESIFESLINHSIKRGYYLLTKLIFELMIEKVQNPFHIDTKKIIIFENFSIINLVKDAMNPKDFLSVLSIAIENNSKQIIKYFFENFVNKTFKLTHYSVHLLLFKSLSLNSTEIFYYLLDQINKIDPKLINELPKFSELLDVASFIKNAEVAKTITDLVIKNNYQLDFTSFFANAASTGNNELLKYFIDKKVLINYEKLSPQIPTFGLINEEIFSIITSNISTESKNRISGCLQQAIKNNNKGLAKYLLKMNPPSSNDLIHAVLADNLEIVDLILECNKEPSFINKVTEKGTALTIAVQNNNLEMVKRFLSLPNIDPNLYCKFNKTPLFKAICNYNYEIMIAILDFYGDKIKSQNWQIHGAVKQIINGIKKNEKKKKNNSKCLLAKKENVLCYLIENNYIYPNYHFKKHTFLTYACKTNSVKLVKTLLKSDKINVNLYEPNKGDTPLIIAIKKNNFEIVKLLIDYPKTNINQRNYDDQTALTIAVCLDLENIVDLIIKSDKFNQEESRLNYAFFISTGEISKQLLSVNSIDINYDTDDINRREVLSSQIKNNDCDSYFSYEIHQTRETNLTSAVILNDIEKVHLIIQQPTFDKVKSQLKTAILFSVENNEIEIFKELIQLVDNDVNMSDFEGKSLLFHSIAHASDDIMTEILNHPNFDSKKSDILSAFIESFGDFNQIQIKSSRKIAKSMKANNKISPIETMNILCDFDRSHDHLIDFTKLLPNGKSFFTICKYGDSYDSDICDFFLLNGCDPNQPDADGIFPLEFSIFNSMGFFYSLIESNLIDYTKQIPLNNNNILNICMDEITDDPLVFGLNYTTYLHMAFASNFDNYTVFLERIIVDINMTNDLGETPLMTACRCNKIDAVYQLFARDDLDYLHINNKGEDALRIVNRNLSNEDLSQIKSKDEYLDMLIKQMSF